MTDDAEILTFAYAAERDIDVLLVEELKCSPDFARWFVGCAAGGRTIAFERVQIAHSRRRMESRREIDIEMRLLGPDAAVVAVVLIENKLGAIEMPRQAESYAEEAEALVAAGRAPVVLTVLVCPDSYAAGHASFVEKFDCRISYDQIAEWLNERAGLVSDELQDRLRHRAALIRQAIDGSRRNSVTVRNTAVSGFTGRYAALVQELHPALLPGTSMLAADKGAEAVTMIFRNAPSWYAGGVRLAHQLREGNANFLFSGWGALPPDVIAGMQADLGGTPYELERANKSLRLAVRTPKVDGKGDFDDQASAIMEGMTLLAALWLWVEGNRDLILSWASRAEPHL